MEKRKNKNRSSSDKKNKKGFIPHPISNSELGIGGFEYSLKKTGDELKKTAKNGKKEKSAANAKKNAVKSSSSSEEKNNKKSKRADASTGSPSYVRTQPQARRRRAGFRQSDISKIGGTQIAPNLSPQFAPEVLKRLGRTADRAQIGIKEQDVSSRSALKVIPLGGLCEVGRNMTVYECGNDMIIVDVGIGFPEENQPGIDSVIPDMSYVFERLSKLRGVFFTHGHEDHIGAVGWLLNKASVPLYGGALTCELIKNKLSDSGLKAHINDLNVVKAGDKIRAGCFEVEFVHVNHSIADAFSLAIRCPAGLAVHSGDFKVDYTPIHGEAIDLQRFAELGSEGVMLFVCESTNIERKGFTPSERSVGDSFIEQFSKAEGRIIVATFSSNVHRVQQIITAAEHFGRKVALSGRSMLNVFEAAESLGYIESAKDTVIELKEIERYPDNKVCIITTGSQGEAMAALTRMAYSEHRNIQIGAGDTVIISATPIPGNEKSIFRVINELYKRQARVIYSDMADIHVSGHAYREEIKLLHALLKPKFFVPAHGEYRHLYIHSQVANSMGQSNESIFILNNGDIFECSSEASRIAGYTNAGAIMIDGSYSDTVDSEILGQRKALSDDGVVCISIAVDEKGLKLYGEPEVTARGFTYEKDMPGLIKQAKLCIRDFMKNKLKNQQGLNVPGKQEQLKAQLKNILYSRTKRRPVILISVICPEA